MAARYDHNYRAFGNHVLQAAWMQAEMEARAERVAAAARAIAPVGDIDSGWYGANRSPGLYKASFQVSSGIRHARTSRAFGRVTNTAPYAGAVEYGYGRTPKYRVLGKSLHAAG